MELAQEPSSTSLSLAIFLLSQMVLFLCILDVLIHQNDSSIKWKSILQLKLPQNSNE